MTLTYNFIAAIIFIIVGSFFGYDALWGSKDFLSRIFAPLFIFVGGARLGIVVWAKKRDARRQATLSENA